MKVERMTEIETNDIHVGDRIRVGHYTATCQEITSIAAIFLLDQYITGKGCLREALQSEEVLNDFADIRNYMVPFEDGDMLKIPYGCGWDNSEIARFRPIFLISLKKEDIVNPQILDESERQYLGVVIRPFRDQVRSITKNPKMNAKGEYIVIDIGFQLENRHKFFMFFPDFKSNTMYKGMELGKEYTLEELGL